MDSKCNHYPEPAKGRVRRYILTAVAIGVLLAAPSAWAQNACDLNGSGAVDSSDVTLAVNMSLGMATCPATINIYGLGVCNVVMVQRVINASLPGGQCITTAHSVSLTWVASTSTGVVGYDVYRGTTSGGPYTLVSSAHVAGTSYTDNSVAAGQTYYYVVTAVDGSNNASAYSNQATASVPTP